MGIVFEFGGVFVVYFGNGIDDLANYIFNVFGVLDLSIMIGVVYVVSLSGVILDVVVFGSFFIVVILLFVDWSGFVFGNGLGIVCMSVWDINIVVDFFYGE